MSFALRSFISLCCVIAPVAVATTRADNGQPAIVHPLAGAQVAPALKAVAMRDHVDVATRDPLRKEAGRNDAVVFWIGTLSGQRRQQWLLQVKRGTATPGELARHKQRDVTEYLSWGSKVTFQSDAEALDLWLAGPVDATDGHASMAPPQTHAARVFVPSGYMRLGLDNSVRALMFLAGRVHALQTEDPKFKEASLYALAHPVPAEHVAQAKPFGDRIGMSPELERAWAGGYVALQSFYTCVESVDALQDIAGVAVQRPSLWKLARLATGTSFAVGFGEPIRLDPIPPALLSVGHETFQLPYAFSLGRDHLVDGVMAVTSPTPPLDVCAGIIAFMAVHPSHPDRVVEAIAISATGTPGAK
jgi:hypothetical protein